MTYPYQPNNSNYYQQQAYQHTQRNQQVQPPPSYGSNPYVSVQTQQPPGDMNSSYSQRVQTQQPPGYNSNISQSYNPLSQSYGQQSFNQSLYPNAHQPISQMNQPMQPVPHVHPVHVPNQNIQNNNIQNNNPMKASYPSLNQSYIPTIPVQNPSMNQMNQQNQMNQMNQSENPLEVYNRNYQKQTNLSVKSRLQGMNTILSKGPNQPMAPIPNIQTPIQHKTLNTPSSGEFDIFHIQQNHVPIWQIPGITNDVPPQIPIDFKDRWYYAMATTIGRDQYASLFLWFKWVDTNGNGQLEPEELEKAVFPGNIRLNRAAAKKFIRIFGSNNNDYLTFFEFIGMFRFLEITYNVHSSYMIPRDMYETLRYRLNQLGFQWVTNESIRILFASFFRDEGKGDMSLDQWVNLATFVLATTNNYFLMCKDGMFVNVSNAYDATLYLNKCCVLIDGVNFA